MSPALLDPSMGGKSLIKESHDNTINTTRISVIKSTELKGYEIKDM